MKIIVLGAGQVGRSVARGLSGDHEITVIDLDPDRLDRLRNKTDVMTIEGDGGQFDVLVEAGTESADMMITCTNDDQTNILACGVATGINEDIFTIARVARTSYLQSWRSSPKSFNLDQMVGSDYQTAQAIVQVAYRKLAHDIDFFSRDQIEMAAYSVPEDCEIAGQTARESDKYEGIRYAAVQTDDEMEVVRGDTVIHGGSRLLVIGRSRAVSEFGRTLAGDSESLDRVFIFGGGEIAMQTARLLEEQEVSPKLIELDSDRAHFLATKLTDTLVLNDDATAPEFLKSEGIQRAQLVISALRPDERNLLSTLLAKELGAGRVLSVVHEAKYQSLFENQGVEITFNPRNLVVEQLLRYTRKQSVEKVSIVENHQGEVVEVELEEDSLLVNKTVEEGMQNFPKDMIIGAFSRKGRVHIPVGDTVLKPGDHLVIFMSSEVVGDVLDKL